MDPRVLIVLRIIKERKASIQFSLRDSSVMLGISEAHLFRLFKHQVGKPFRTYLRDFRMIQASESLKQSAVSIKQVALDCGYSDISNFYRDFKSVHGTTPREMQLGHLTALTKANLGGSIAETVIPAVAGSVTSKNKALCAPYPALTRLQSGSVV